MHTHSTERCVSFLHKGHRQGKEERFDQQAAKCKKQGFYVGRPALSGPAWLMILMFGSWPDAYSACFALALRSAYSNCIFLFHRCFENGWYR